MIQLYIYIYLFYFRFFPLLGYYKTLSIVPCAVQQILVGYLFYIYLRAQLCLTLCDPLDTPHQAPLAMELSRQECWGGLPVPSPGDLLLTQGSNPRLLRLLPWQVDSSPPAPPGNPCFIYSSVHVLIPDSQVFPPPFPFR